MTGTIIWKDWMWLVQYTNHVNTLNDLQVISLDNKLNEIQLHPDDVDDLEDILHKDMLVEFQIVEHQKARGIVQYAKIIDFKSA